MTECRDAHRSCRYCYKLAVRYARWKHHGGWVCGEHLAELECAMEREENL